MKLKRKMYHASILVLMLIGLTLLPLIKDCEQKYVYAYIGFFIVTSIALIFAMLEYYVFYRLRFIDIRLDEILKGETKKRIVDTSKNDEISNISKNINIALDALEESKNELKKKNQMYDSIFEDTPLLVLRFLEDGTITYVNDSYCRAYGENKNSFIGKNFFKHIDRTGGNIETVRKNFKSLSPKRPASSYFYDTPVVIDGSSPRWIMWSNRAFFNESNGRVQEYQSVGMDIYNQKNSSEKFKSILDNALNVVFFINKEGRIRYVSSSSESILQMHSTDMVGKKIFEYIDENDVEEFNRHFYRCVSDKESCIKEFRVKTFKEPRLWMQATIDAILDPQDQIDSIIISMRDVSEIKKAQDQVTEAFDEMKNVLERMSTLESIIDETPVIAFAWKNSNKVDYVSKNITLLGYTVEDFTSGKIRFLDIVHKEDLDIINLAEYEQQKEYRIISKHGEIINVRDKAFTVEKNIEHSIFYRVVEILPRPCGDKA